MFSIWNKADRINHDEGAIDICYFTVITRNDLSWAHITFGPSVVLIRNQFMKLQQNLIDTASDER